MTSPKLHSIVTAITAAAMLTLNPALLTTQAHAYDDDVEVICGENDDGTDWCVSVEDLKAECPLSDPDGESEECAGLEESESRGPKRPQSLSSSSGSKTPTKKTPWTPSKKIGG